MVEVVAALIWNDDKFMICQRPAGKAQGLLWELPGGKVEQGESNEEALARECREELGIEVSVGDVFTEATHDYPEICIHLAVYNCVVKKGVPRKIEHNDIKWITAKDISLFSFCPADEVILQNIM